MEIMRFTYAPLRLEIMCLYVYIYNIYIYIYIYIYIKYGIATKRCGKYREGKGVYILPT